LGSLSATYTTPLTVEVSSSEATTSDESSSLGDESSTGSDSASDSASDSDSSEETSETSSESEASSTEEQSVDLTNFEVGGELGDEKVGDVGVDRVPSERILDNDWDGKGIEMTAKATIVETIDAPTTVSRKETTETNPTPSHTLQNIIRDTNKLSQPSANPEPSNSPMPSAHSTPDKMDSTSINSSSSSDNLFASGGWGDEPEPAPWEWTQMPLDYMGILAEQRRTVFHEFRISDGKGEWRRPKYSGPPNYYGILRLRWC
jgi:hypothetical protein